MRGGRLTGVVALLCCLAFAGLVAAAAVASGGPLHGRYYDGAPPNTGGAVQFSLDFQTSRDGHQLRHLTLSVEQVLCAGNQVATPEAPGNETVAVSGAGRFKISEAATDYYSTKVASDKLVLSGHFGADGTVSGKLSFTGSGPLAGCHKTTIWKGKVRPLLDRFVGTVKQGSGRASISFYRTVAHHSDVTDFSVGALTLSCSGGGTSRRSFESVDPLTVHPDAKFGGSIFFTNGEAGAINGKFRGAGHASGKVSYVGRDNCSYGGLSWSVHRVAKSVLGPLNFG